MGGVTTELPIWLVVVVVVVIPLAVAVLLGLVTFRRITPLAYRCQRCGRDFVRPPFRGFPTACGRCSARDWNAPG